MNNFNGLSFINCELTSRCNKNCWMCGRRKIDKDYPEIKMNYGNMEFSLIEKIAKELPPNIIVAFHWNGEGLLYPEFGKAVKLFNKQIRVLDTNGKLLVEKANDIIHNLDTLTVSVIQDDPEADEQYKTVKKFLKIKGNKPPLMVYRILGDVKNVERWEELGGIIVRRILHSPMGSFDYQKAPTIPEIGICIEALNHLAIDRFGNVSMCVRFDPLGLGILGNVNDIGLSDIWNGKKRKKLIDLHTKGKRDEIPLCDKCHYYGVPRG